MEFITLENDIVKLKPLELNDSAGLLTAGRYPEIWSYMSTTIEKRKDVDNFVEKALMAKQQQTEFPFVIVDKQSGKIVGSTRFMNIDEQHQRLEIGYTWLTSAYWRTAINTNCKYLLLQYCFEQLHLQRVQIKTDHENVRSQTAIERIDATKEGILRNHMIRKDEWPRVKKHLQKLLVQSAV